MNVSVTVNVTLGADEIVIVRNNILVACVIIVCCNFSAWFKKINYFA